MNDTHTKKTGWFAPCIAIVLIACGCERPAESKSTPIDHESRATSTKPVEVPELDLRWQGICLAHSWERDGVRGYGTDASAEAITHLERVGANALSITPFGFMNDLSSKRVRGEHEEDADLPGGVERSERVLAVSRQAREAGMDIVLKPHIWIRGGEWRGRIKPGANTESDWKEWWASYRQFILFWAEIARQARAEGLVIGVELASALARDPLPLIELADEVRRIYDGSILYAANWNEPVPDAVWKSMDSVGVQFYPPISKEMKTTESEMRATLRDRLDEWSEIAARVGKPLVLTEVGYRSANSAARYPFAWPEKSHESYSKPDPELQRSAYRSLFLELAETPRLDGVFVWKYFTNRETDEEGPDGFSPRGKPAEEILVEAYDGAK